MRRFWIALLFILLLVSPGWAQIAKVNDVTPCVDFSAGSPVASLSCAHTIASTTFTDNFNRANSADLGAAWDPIGTPMALNTNAIRASVLNTVTTEYYNAATGLSPNQYTKVTLSAATGATFQVVRVGVRRQAGVASGYACEIWRNTGHSTIFREDNGNGTALTANIPTAWAAGDIAECRINGSSITFLRNGSPVATATDSTYSSGRPGLAVFLATGGALSDIQLDDFEAGNATGSVPNGALTVGVVVRDPSAADAVMNTVTWNGTPLLKACEALYNDGSTVVGSSMWYLANPASASANIVATPTGTVNEIAITGTLWSGVHQGTPKAAHACNAGPEPTGGVMSTNIQTTGNGQMVTDALFSTTENTFSAIGNGQTIQFMNQVTNGTDLDSYATGYKLMTLGGTQTMSYTAVTPSTFSRFAYSALALTPANSTETLTWSESDASTSQFNIEWSNSAVQSFTPQQSVVGGAGNFSATSTYSGVNNRCYRVNAVNAIGASPYSNLASAPGFINVISPASQPNGTVGVAYPGIAVSASGCVPPIAITATGLPPGVNLSTGGIWTGAPTAAGTYNIVVMATDSNLTPRSNTVTYTITIAAAVAVTLSPSTQPAGQVGTTYAGTTVTASGGTGPYTFSATGLPPGVTLSSGGIFGGIPTSPGSYTTVVSATDAGAITGNITYTIVIAAAPVTNLSLSPATQPQGYVGVAYGGTTITATGGVAPYTFTSSNRPPGVSLSVGGVFSGTATTGGTYAMVVTATDSTGGTPKVGSITYNIVINPTPPPLTLSPGTQAAGTVGVAYSGVGTTVTATGGTGTYTFTATGLPTGVTLGTDGTWGGTPTVAQTVTTTVMATDTTAVEDGGPLTGTKVYTILINPAAAISIAPATQPPGVVGFTYSGEDVVASGGTGPYTYAHTGCPTGIDWDVAGVMSGTPTEVGTFDCSVTATDSLAAEGNIHYLIGISPVLDITPLAQPNGFVGTPYAGAPLVGSGGTAPYTFTATSLPAGVVLAANGQWTGTPTTVQSVSTVVTVVDSSTPVGTATITYPITIAPASATQTPFTLTWSYSGVDVNGGLEMPSYWIIEQSTTPEGNFSQIAQVTAVQSGRLITSYQITVPPFPTGCWKVRAGDAAGNLSNASAPYCRSGDGSSYADVTPPSRPFSVTGH